MTEKNESTAIKKYRCITERFCSRLGDNAIIVTTVTEQGEEQKCLCPNCCEEECEHKKRINI